MNALVRTAVLAAVATSGACVGNEDTRPPTWSFISTTIIQPSCATAGCHSTFAQTAGVVLDDREAGYDALVGGPQPFVRVGTACVDGEPPDDQHSQLLDLLRGDEIYRMPPDAPLPAADVELIRTWICDGAEDD